MAVWEILVEVYCNDGYSWGYTFKDFNGKFSLFSFECMVFDSLLGGYI
jgi:hypothetical protein